MTDRGHKHGCHLFMLPRIGDLGPKALPLDPDEGSHYTELFQVYTIKKV
jgi:hypothetical protein